MLSSHPFCGCAWFGGIGGFSHKRGRFPKLAIVMKNVRQLWKPGRSSKNGKANGCYEKQFSTPNSRVSVTVSSSRTPPPRWQDLVHMSLHLAAPFADQFGAASEDHYNRILQFLGFDSTLRAFSTPNSHFVFWTYGFSSPNSQQPALKTAFQVWIPNFPFVCLEKGFSETPFPFQLRNFAGHCYPKLLYQSVFKPTIGRLHPTSLCFPLRAPATPHKTNR